jgi:hypothetical protein
MQIISRKKSIYATVNRGHKRSSISIHQNTKQHQTNHHLSTKTHSIIVNELKHGITASSSMTLGSAWTIRFFTTAAFRLSTIGFAATLGKRSSHHLQSVA